MKVRFTIGFGLGLGVLLVCCLVIDLCWVFVRVFNDLFVGLYMLLSGFVA